MDRTNASAIVTGGAGSFGSATMRRLAWTGAKVVIADVSDERGEALAREVGAGSLCLPTDCIDDDAIATAAAGLLPLRAAVQSLSRHGLHIGRTLLAPPGRRVPPPVTVDWRERHSQATLGEWDCGLARELGGAGRCEKPGGDPGGPGPRYHLVRHRGRLRPGAFRGSARQSPGQPAQGCGRGHQMRTDLGRAEHRHQQPALRIGPARSGCQLEAAEDRLHRSVSAALPGYPPPCAGTGDHARDANLARRRQGALRRRIARPPYVRDLSRRAARAGSRGRSRARTRRRSPATPAVLSPAAPG